MPGGIMQHMTYWACSLHMNYCGEHWSLDSTCDVFVCLAFFVYAMMYPTMQALQRLAASRRLQSPTFQVILATGW